MNDPGSEAGAQRKAVGRQHEALRRAGYRIPQGEAAGRFFGAATRSAITRYQQDHALAVNGRADAATLSIPEIQCEPRRVFRSSGSARLGREPLWSWSGWRWQVDSTRSAT